jgi:NRPS condensation-like uncharacterized protein
VTSPAAAYAPGAAPPISRQPFGVLDELACYHDSAAEPINVHIELRLPGPIDGRRLRQAVSAVMAGQPRARVRGVAGGWRHGFDWEVPAATDVDPVAAMTGQNERDLDAARVRFLATAPPLDQSPPFRILLVSGPGWDSLILNAHHVAFDGRSCLRLLRLIADEYSADECSADECSGTTSSAEGPRPTAPDSASPPPGGGRPRSRGRPARIAAQPAAGTRPGKAPGYGVGLLAFPDVPAPPPGAGDGPRPTVNDLLIAALMLTIARWNAARHRPPGPILITMPIDARAPGQQDELGNRSRLCTIAAQPDDIEAGLLTTVPSQTGRAKREPGPNENPLLAALARTWLPTTVKRRVLRLAVGTLGRIACDTSLLSNLGNVTDPPRFGPLSPTGIWFSTSAHMPRGLSVGAVTVDGRLHVCFRYRYALFGDAAADEFVAAYAAALASLTRTEAPR